MTADGAGPQTDDSWGNDDPVAPSGPAALASMSPARAQLVQAIGEGRLAPPRIQDRNGAISPDAQALIADVAQAYPKFDSVDAPRRVAAAKAWTSGKLGQQAVTIGTALEHAMTLNDAIDTLGNVHSPVPLTTHLANDVSNWASDQDGNSPIAAYRATTGPVLGELSKAFHGGSSEGSVKRLDFTLPEGGSPQQQRAAVQQYIKLLAGKLSELKGGYNKAMGITAEGLPMISDQANANLAAFLSPDYVDKGFTQPASGGSTPGAPTVGGAGNGPRPGDGGAGGAPASPTAGGPVAPSSPAAPAAPAMALSADGSSDMVATRDKPAAAEAQRLLDSGAQRPAFDALTAKYGIPAYGSDLDQAIAWRDKHGKGATILPAHTHTGPSFSGAVMNSGVGTAATGFANTATFGMLPKGVALARAGLDKLGGDQRSFGDVYGNDLADAHGR